MSAVSIKRRRCIRQRAATISLTRSSATAEPGGVATLRQCTIDCRSNYLRVMKVLSGGAKCRDMKISPGFDQMEGHRGTSLANFEIACRESFSMRVKSDLSLRYCLAEA